MTFPNTTFTYKSTVIPSPWLQAVNDFIAQFASPNIAALRMQLKTGPATLFVTGYYTAGDGGGGWYYYDSTDTTSSDNGGTIIVATDGGRWKLTSTTSLSVRQFGAKGDGVTNDATAVQNTANALAAGGAMYVPPGTYFLGTSSITLPVGVSIRGSGSLVTVFSTAYVSSSTPAFILNGSSVSSKVFAAYSGFFVSGNGVGQAFQATQLAYAQFNDVHTNGFSLHWNLVDCQSMQFISCRSISGTNGLWARIGTVSAPNAFTFVGCVFGSMTTTGLQFDAGSALCYIGGSIEGCGTFPASGTSAAVLLNGPGQDGSLAASFIGTYFENNAGFGDIYLIGNTTAGFPSKIDVRALFNRISSARYTNSNIYVTQGVSDSPLSVDISGSSFQGYNSYATSAARPYVDLSNALGVVSLTETGALYGSATEAPTFNKAALTAGTNMGATTGKATAYRKSDGTIQLSGYMNATGSVTSGTVIGTIPAAFVANRSLPLIPIGVSSVGITFAAIDGSGNISLGVSLTNGENVDLDGIRYQQIN